MKYRFMDLVWTRPGDVQPMDAFAIKIVAVVGYANDWTAYMGPPDWPDETVAEMGDKLFPEQAKPLFYVLRESGRVYRF